MTEPTSDDRTRSIQGEDPADAPLTLRFAQGSAEAHS
jgi:hypothetical protein